MAASANACFLDNLIQWIMIVIGVVIGGLNIPDIPTSQSLEMRAGEGCVAGAVEIDWALLFVSTSIGCCVVPMILTSWAKGELISLFGEEVDEKMRDCTAATSRIKWAVFFGMVTIAAALLCALSTVCFMVQMKTKKFNCMHTGYQAAWIGFIFGAPFFLLLGWYHTAKRNFGATKDVVAPSASKRQIFILMA